MPAAPASAGQETTGAGTAAAVAGALSAALAAEQQSVYAYQAALPRLAAKDAGAAGAFLAEHEDLAAEATAHTRAACSAAQAQQPGYVLDPDFLAAPAAGLAAWSWGRCLPSGTSLPLPTAARGSGPSPPFRPRHAGLAIGAATLGRFPASSSTRTSCRTFPPVPPLRRQDHELRGRGSTSSPIITAPTPTPTNPLRAASFLPGQGGPGRLLMVC